MKLKAVAEIKIIEPLDIIRVIALVILKPTPDDQVLKGKSKLPSVWFIQGVDT